MPGVSASCGAFTNVTGSSCTGPKTPFRTDSVRMRGVVVGDLALDATSSSLGSSSHSDGEQAAEPLGERQEGLHGLGGLGRGDVHRERHELAREREQHLLGDGVARLVLRFRGAARRGAA